MLNNLFFYITFWMHNNLSVIIKIFSTVYLLRAVLFPSVPLEGMHPSLLVPIGIMSLGYTELEIFSLKWRKKGQIPIAVSQQLLDL